MAEDDIQTRLMEAIGGSCTCLTKTPEVAAHSPQCHYRILAEAEEALGKANASLAVIQDLASMCWNEMQGRLADDTHRRAHTVLGLIITLTDPEETTEADADNPQ